MPAGLLVTVPVPLLERDTVSAGKRSKTATTCRSATIFKIQGWVPEQACIQPTNIEPGSGVAVRVTEVPLEYVAEQALFALPQSIPEGLLVTLPVPVPVVRTVVMKGPLSPPNNASR